MGKILENVLQIVKASIRMQKCSTKLYLEGACCSEEVVHGILESLCGASVVPCPHL